MNKVSFAYVIYENFKNKDGKYPIKLRITYKQSPAYYKTNLIADPTELTFTKGNKILIRANNLKRKAEDLVRSYEDVAKDFNPLLFPEYKTAEVMKYLEKAIKSREGFRLGFVAYANDFITQKQLSTSKKAASNYSCALKALCLFIGKEEFDISIITSTLMRNWEAWLRKKYGEKARAVSLYTSSIAAIHVAAQNEFNTEELDKIYIPNPFKVYKCPKQPSSRHRCIDLSFIQNMINDYPTLTGRERLAVGSCLLSFALMGMNFPDLYECEKPEKGIIHYFRRKTRDRRSDNAEIFIKIPDCIAPLFEEYKDRSKKKAFNFYHHYSDYTNLEHAEYKGLKKYKERSGFKGELSAYIFRHTWATTAKSCRISMDTIDECLVHVGSHRISDIYAKKDYSLLWEANEKVLAQLDWQALSK